MHGHLTVKFTLVLIEVCTLPIMAVFCSLFVLLSQFVAQIFLYLLLFLLCCVLLYCVS